MFVQRELVKKKKNQKIYEGSWLFFFFSLEQRSVNIKEKCRNIP